MNIQKLLLKKVERKKFFYAIGTGFTSMLLLKSFPINFLMKNKLAQTQNMDKIKVRINPLSVSRNKLGEKNG